jgi:hypothetical protein
MPSLHAAIYRLATVLVPLSIALTAYLYLYPFAHQCAFPSPPPRSQTWLQGCAFEDDVLKEYYRRGDIAPFRLLALGDPQLEGDTSLPQDVEKKFPGFEQLRQEFLDQRWEEGAHSVAAGVEDLWATTVRILQYTRKYLDLLGNDFYLAHIYHTLHWTTQPTHVTVLGDLLGSQWIDDEEFENRAGRFWHRVFKGAEVTPASLLQNHANEEMEDPVVQVLGADDGWKRRIVNVAGNHDIGYAGDVVRSRVDRFEAVFGGVNGDVRFTLPIQQCNTTATSEDIPTLRLVVLNSMNLDSPVLDGDLQQESFRFINSVIDRSDDVGKHSTSTILLTHIPLHKEPGVCVDAPYFSYFNGDQGGGIQEQNMISKDVSAQAILQGVFGKSPDTLNTPAQGLGRGGIILTGHDHEGCDVYHYVDHERGEWAAGRYASDEAVNARQNASVPGLREVTVRSMMGEFGGYAALVSAWWDQQQGKWQIDVEMCSLGVQHIWWAVHIIDLLAVVFSLLALIIRTTRTATKAPKDKVVSFKPVRAIDDVMRAKPPKEGEIKVSPPKKKSSAFSRRMRQSLEEGRVEQDSDSDVKRKKSPGSKQSKKKPTVKLKKET